MAFRQAVLALGLIGVAASASAATRERTAPPGGPGTRYCMKVEAITGSRIEPVVCWTREQWADQGVDVDRDWPKEGVRVIG